MDRQVSRTSKGPKGIIRGLITCVFFEGDQSILSSGDDALRPQLNLRATEGKKNNDLY